MSRYKITMSDAEDLQEWALKESGTGKYLKNLPELPQTKKIKPGLYVSYDIIDSLEDAIDWPDIGVAIVYAILKDGTKEFIGEIRAYDWRAYWLSTIEEDEIESAKKWFELINEDYKKLIESSVNKAERKDD